MVCYIEAISKCKIPEIVLHTGVICNRCFKGFTPVKMCGPSPLARFYFYTDINSEVNFFVKFSFCKGKQLTLGTFLVALGGRAIPATCTSIFHKNFLHKVGHLSGFFHYSEPIPTYIPGWGWSGFTLTTALLNWHVQVFYIRTIDLYKRLYCNRQPPGN